MVMVVVAVFVQRPERHGRGLLRLAKKKSGNGLDDSSEASQQRGWRKREKGNSQIKDKTRAKNQNLIKTNKPPGEQGGGEASDRGGKIQGPMVSRPAIERGSRSAC